MSAPDFFHDNGHVLIAGITGSRADMGGKTALANWWLSKWGAERDLRIFFNAKGTPSVRGETVHSVDAIADRMADGVEHFNFVPPTEDWATPHQRLREFIAALPTDLSKMVVHDETPEYADETGSLSWFLKVGGQAEGTFAANCKSLVLAQNPIDLNKTERTQTPTHVWVGPTSSDYVDYFRKKGFKSHYDYIQAEHDPYDWTVMQGPREGDRTTFDPVPEEYA